MKYTLYKTQITMCSIKNNPLLFLLPNVDYSICVCPGSRSPHEKMVVGVEDVIPKIDNLINTISD